jgi:hypothetical protein
VLFRCLKEHEGNNMHSLLCASLGAIFTATGSLLDFYTTCVDIFLISHLTHPPTRRMVVDETIESLLLLSSETLHLSVLCPWPYCRPVTFSTGSALYRTIGCVGRGDVYLTQGRVEHF